MSEAAVPSVGADPNDRKFFGHPKGLAILFFTEMWERFSFYGMRAMLTLYLIQHFLIGPREAQGIYAAYGSLVYLMPVIGGLIADRYLGSRKAVTIGAVLLVLGHFGMAFEGSGAKQYVTVGEQRYEIVAEGRGESRTLEIVSAAGQRTGVEFSSAGMTLADPAALGLPQTLAEGDYGETVARDPFFEQILYLSLALIIVGVGFLKANISTIVGAIYAKTDPRRDQGFTIFYMGINLGSLLATAFCTWLGFTYGWKYGFGLAGLGMLAGLVTFLTGQKYLLGKADPPAPEKLRRPVAGPVSLEATIYILGLLAVIPMWFLIGQHDIVTMTLTIGAPLIFLAMFLWVGWSLRGHERSRMFVALILIVFSVLFWTLFEQAGSSLTLYANNNTNLSVLGLFSINAGQTQLFNPGLIVLLGPLFVAMWAWLARRNIEPSTAAKFGLGIVQVGLGFLVLVFGIEHFVGPDFRVPLLWLFLAYLFHTTGELCLSPVGLSMITRLSVPRVVGLMMGVWFLSSALAHTLAGLIAQETSTDTVAGVVKDAGAQLASYQSVFSTIGWVAVGIGVLLTLLSPILSRYMHLDTLSDADDLAGSGEIGEAQAAGVHPESKGS
ncbi:MAG: MFS transporter [Alphaproteobacteria bacterium HGW-Alphaproteobacteria-13]|jgi:POT family proton-dependent oligopeptide transporter|nr:MAG: MFS transporter [Alphaproteobacteria bacterium HGW-Alphaproteobacteria-13]